MSEHPLSMEALLHLMVNGEVYTTASGEIAWVERVNEDGTVEIEVQGNE